MAYEAIVEPFQLNPRKPVPGIEPGSSAWKAEVLSFTPHGHCAAGHFKDPACRALPLCTKRARASRRDRTDNLLVTNQLRFRLRQRSMIGAEGIEPT